ncbi:MAG: alanine racemase [Lachnospiraceae bacterium]|nr:alanine racemase [Lachnospiraceae bacterium]
MNRGRYTRVYATVDLDAVAANMESMQRNLAPGVGMIGVVKADGYGHGAVPVAKAIGPYVKGYAVATAQEAMQLRRHGIAKPVLVLGVVHPIHFRDLIEQRVRPAIFTMEQACALSGQAKSLGKTADFHLVVDTGMGRIGMGADPEGARLAAAICGLPSIRAEGIFTHFARADEEDKTSADKQLLRFHRFVGLLEGQGVRVPIKHCANSAAILDLPGAHFDLVRAGISLYGMYPSGQVNKGKVPLQPAMGLKSFITYVKDVKPGQEISYGGTFTATEPMKVATLPVGYGDGYPRNLSGCGKVLIAGKPAPILGRVCMDQFMVDVSKIPEAVVDAEATLIGRDGGEQITIEDLARWGGGFHYEIACNLGKRVPRAYFYHGEAVGAKDYFDDQYLDFM